jgi:hypothetical protein
VVLSVRSSGSPLQARAIDVVLSEYGESLLPVDERTELAWARLLGGVHSGVRVLVLEKREEAESSKVLGPNEHGTARASPQTQHDH